MSHHHDQLRTEFRRGELDAAHLRRRDDVAGDADDEEIAEALIEHELGRHARVGAAKDDREGRLIDGERAQLFPGERLIGQLAGDEPAVPLAQEGERICRRNHATGTTRVTLTTWPTRYSSLMVSPGSIVESTASLPTRATLTCPSG